MSCLRRSLSLSGLLCAALVVTGCGMGSFTTVEKNVANPAVAGKAMGGQQPVSGATISIYTFGTGGYGSAGTQLYSTTTDANGNFSIPGGAYTCPQSNTPTYLIGVGGDAGYGANSAIVLGAALGPCNGPAQVVILNEVTTVALAYAESGYFTQTLGVGQGTADQYDSFGGPSSTDSSNNTLYANGMVLGNNYTAGLIAINSNGLAYANNGIVTAEPLKVYSLANTLAACINSSGSGSTECGNLFSYTTTPSGFVPSDTLQAAVQIALYPYQNVSQLYALAGSKPPFNADLATYPPDWTIAVSYTSSSLGLGVDTNTMSTIDVDTSNRVWFPSTASGNQGVAYFDQTSTSFSGPYNATSMVHPEQVAVDGNGYVWATDTQGHYVSRYKASLPTSGYGAIGIQNGNTVVATTSRALRVDAGGNVWVGLYDPTSSAYKLGYIDSGLTTYTESTVTLPTNYVPYSIAADNNAAATGNFVSNQSNLLLTMYNSAATGSTAATQLDYLANTATAVTNRLNVFGRAGQALFTNNDLASIYAWDGSSTSTHLNDGMCFTGEPNSNSTTAKCYQYAHSKTTSFYAQGGAVDGLNNVWVADEGNGTVVEVLANTLTGAYSFSGTSSNPLITSKTYYHNAANGGTLVNPEGVGVDNEGNVWISNAGCLGTGCTPGSFVLSEIIGTAAPTITPVAGQIQGGNFPGTEPNY